MEMKAGYGTEVTLFPTDATETAANGREYMIYDACGLAYDSVTKAITTSPLLCGECGLPVGEWDFQEARNGRQNGYGICANKHMTIIGPYKGAFMVVSG